MGEGFCRPVRQKIAGILCVFQDFLTRQDGKNTTFINGQIMETETKQGHSELTEVMKQMATHIYTHTYTHKYTHK